MADKTGINRRGLLYSASFLSLTGCIGGDSAKTPEEDLENNDSAQNTSESDDENKDDAADQPPERNERISMTASLVDPDSVATACISPDDMSLKGTQLLSFLRDRLADAPPAEEWPDGGSSVKPGLVLGSISKSDKDFNSIENTLESISSKRNYVPCLAVDEYTISIRWNEEWNE